MKHSTGFKENVPKPKNMVMFELRSECYYKKDFTISFYLFVQNATICNLWQISIMFDTMGFVQNVFAAPSFVGIASNEILANL